MRQRASKQTCQRKVKHFTKQAAYDALRKLRNDEYCEDPRSLHVYFCDRCARWHVGHRPVQFVK